MNRISMFPHAGSGNHGCEAIVRSTENLFSGHEIQLFSNRPQVDEKYMVDCGVSIHMDTDEVRRFSLRHIRTLLQRLILGKADAFDRATFEPVLKACGKDDILLSIGGDLYCYDPPEYIYRVNRYVREQGCKTVLWGCSVEPALLENTAIAKDLASYDLITARETISYEALKKVNPSTVLVSDPAFTLERKDLPLPEGWIEGNTIGINASPLILNSGNRDLVLNAYRRLVEEILKTTDCAIALIPHVVWDNNDDRHVLHILYDAYRSTGRILMIDDCNCMELKGYIARCRMFIGARTHATIAAYSTCVPTLVLGYSVKSKGIAKDLFGTDEHYVLPVKGLRCDTALADGFKWLLMNEDQIRDHLKTCMPEYVNNAYRVVSSLNRLIR